MSEVFISYRHENDPHCVRVRDLAGRLEAEGISVILDGFAESRNYHGGAPPRGWAMWSIQMATDAPSVLIIGSSGWFQVINNSQPTTSGKGAAAEAETVIARLYQKSGYNDFVGIGYFDATSDLATLPLYLDKCARFDFTDPKRFEALVQWIKRPLSPGIQQQTLPPPVASAAVVSMLMTSAFPHISAPINRSGFLDCKDAFHAFERLLNPDHRTRVLLLEGEGEHGKSELTTRFFTHANQVLAPHSAAFIRFSPPVKDPLRFLDTMSDSYGVTTQESASLENRTRALLVARASQPTILFVDGFEHAEDRHRLWIDDFLSRVVSQPLLRIVIAGRRVPSHSSQPWTIYSRHVHCDPFEEPEAFIQHGVTCGSSMPPEEIRACCTMMRNQRDERKRAGQPTDGLSPLVLISEIKSRRQGGASV